jgi:lipopolysaccharide transport system ATP-binding protein
MNNVVIQVDHLSKEYRLGTIGRKRLVDDVNRWWARFRGKEDPLSKVGQPKAESRKQKLESPRLASSNSPISALNSHPSERYWALKDVSFEVKQGEVLGIIGRNGAGKSTLLKILSRVTGPTSGEVRVKGRIASLLEVGTGFHPELTGRENVFLNGAILGMTKAEIRSKLDEIVDFSGVEKFIDTPVKRYSSGMTVRLAFAVAAHLEPEILIVDEVLSVGDAEFQKKCLGKMQDVSNKEGRTVLFVSHNMGVISSLCKMAIWLEGGLLKRSGEARSIVQNYLSNAANDAGQFHELASIPRKDGYGEKLRLLSLEWLTGYPVQHGTTVRLAMHCKAMADCLDFSAGIGFSSLEGVRLLTYDTDLVANSRHKVSRGEQVRFEIEIPDLPVSPGIYNLDLGIRSGDMHQLDFMAGAVQVDVIPGASTPGFIMRQGTGIRLPSASRIFLEQPSS